MKRNNLGKILRTQRLRNKFSQDEISALLSISKSTYSNYERGVRTPSIEIIISISSIYKINPMELMVALIPSSLPNMPDYSDLINDYICLTPKEQQLIAFLTKTLVEKSRSS